MRLSFSAVILVALGGALGATLRYVIATAMASRSTTFPTGTLLINLTGCLLIGLVAGMLGGKLLDDPEYASTKALLVAGFLGGYTTFSAFGFETYRLLAASRWNLALAYLAASNAGGIALVALGAWVGRKVA